MEATLLFIKWTAAFTSKVRHRSWLPHRPLIECDLCCCKLHVRARAATVVACSFCISFTTQGIGRGREEEQVRPSHPIAATSRCSQIFLSKQRHLATQSTSMRTPQCNTNRRGLCRGSGCKALQRRGGILGIPGCFFLASGHSFLVASDQKMTANSRTPVELPSSVCVFVCVCA